MNEKALYISFAVYLWTYIDCFIGPFKAFMIYRLVVAAFVLVIIATGTRPATIPEAQGAPMTHAMVDTLLPR